MNDIEILKSLEKGNEKTLKVLMDQHKKGLYAIARNGFPFGEEVVEDVFLNSIMEFYERVLDKRFTYTGPNCIRNHLWTTFKRRLINELEKRNNRRRLHPKVLDSSEHWQYAKKADEDLLRSEKEKLIREAMTELSPRCQKVLTLFYFEGLSLKEIGEQMELKNQDTTKATRYQCFKKLEAIVKRKVKKEDL